MRKTKMFKSFDEYENWTNQFENCSDYEKIPVYIDDGFKISADAIIECKTWKTALNRFEKAFPMDVLNPWIEIMKESCGSGYFEDIKGWMPAYACEKEELKEIAKSGTYSWGVEYLDENLWYIYLNVSGGYR